jgi:hypothetical protein
MTADRQPVFPQITQIDADTGKEIQRKDAKAQRVQYRRGLGCPEWSGGDADAPAARRARRSRALSVSLCLCVSVVCPVRWICVICVICGPNDFG